jgi:hypothetical protein
VGLKGKAAGRPSRPTAIIGLSLSNPEGYFALNVPLFSRFGEHLDNPGAPGIAGFPVGLFHDLNLHNVVLCTVSIWRNERFLYGPALVARRRKHLDDPGAARIARFPVGLLDNLNLHGLVLCLSESGLTVVACAYRRCSTATSTSHGRSVPFFLSASFLSFFTASSSPCL